MTHDFWDQGFTIVEGLLDPSQVAFVSQAMDVSHKRGAINDTRDMFVHGAQDEYSPVLGELFLRECRTRIEQAVGRELLSTYAYWRIYHEGAKLDPHTDRESSELAVSITIEADPPDRVWPIGVEGLDGKEASLELPPGTGVLYQGLKVSHWREPLDFARQKQLMLFYVLKDGELADYAHDRRGGDPLTGEKT